MKFTIFYIIILISFIACQNSQDTYLNISNDVNYIGMHQCAACHSEQYSSFMKTGMGNSMRPAMLKNSSMVIDTFLYDSATQFNYRPYWLGDSLFVKEYILNNKSIHDVDYYIDYIIGSGHHTNSHLFSNNGYLYQAPFTYYTQDSILDFPPGFEEDNNTRFSRKMGLECIACHNAYPDFVLGSENKYNTMPNGIDCERCHGPGEMHLKKIQSGDITDTIHGVDYTILNPSNLSVELQNDLCARCHLQGNAVLKTGKSFFDFLPGMYLRDVMDVYLPRYSNAENEFIMASHVDRMKLSQCYINSDNGISCITCHNPHKSVKETTSDFFNNKCLGCHSQSNCKEVHESKNALNNNCVSCHMPSSSTIDIPHVKITDHKIAIHHDDTSLINKHKEKVFLGLECVNNDTPTNESIVQAYLQQYERFEKKSYYLDSASYYLNSVDLNTHKGIYIHIYYLFLKEDYSSIAEQVRILNADTLLNNKLIYTTYSNQDAWTCYRIGEAFTKLDNLNLAFQFYQQAVKLAPYNLEFRNKYGVALFYDNKIDFAIDEFNFIINEDSNFVPAYNNLGYLYFTLNNKDKALQYYNYALKLNPNHKKTLINKSSLLLFYEDYDTAFLYITKLLELYPLDNEVINLFDQLNELS